jgi:hypothetical protein
MTSMPAFESLESFMSAMSGSAQKEERASCKPINTVLVNMQIQAKKPESGTKGLLVHPHRPSRPEECTKIPYATSFANYPSTQTDMHMTTRMYPAGIRTFWKCEHGRRGDTCRLCVGDEEAGRIRALERLVRQQMEIAAKRVKTEVFCQTKSITCVCETCRSLNLSFQSFITPTLIYLSFI